jgi:hypothetical protein
LLETLTKIGENFVGDQTKAQQKKGYSGVALEAEDKKEEKSKG